MRARATSQTSGFSLIELLTVIVVVGILAAIALPNLRRAIYNAQAADVIGDLRAVQLAYSQYIGDGGTRIPNAGWGTVPSELKPYLPEGFGFATELADYRWTRLKAQASPWGEESGMVRVRPKKDLRDALIPRLAAMANEATTVRKSRQVRFLLVP